MFLDFFYVLAIIKKCTIWLHYTKIAGIPEQDLCAMRDCHCIFVCDILFLIFWSSLSYFCFAVRLYHSMTAARL